MICYYYTILYKLISILSILYSYRNITFVYYYILLFIVLYYFYYFYDFMVAKAIILTESIIFTNIYIYTYSFIYLNIGVIKNKRLSLIKCY